MSLNIAEQKLLTEKRVREYEKQIDPREKWNFRLFVQNENNLWASRQRSSSVQRRIDLRDETKIDVTKH